MQIANEIQQSVDYLSSPEALQSLGRSSYWPKWHGPWWHMLLLHELGETKRIPMRVVDAFIKALNDFPLKTFPIQPGDVPDGIDVYDTFCHCQLGNCYQVLSARGIDVDLQLPWMRRWFLTYQMADGGFNCDNGAYLVKDECPSSMVATVPVFEAVLLYTQRAFTDAEIIFLDKAAKFLMDRKLILGSPTNYNAEERTEALRWSQPCFPRFYMYDVLRGLSALLLWAEKLQRKVPYDCIRDAVTSIEQRVSNGVIKLERHCYEGTTTRMWSSTHEWVRKQPATFFSLLERCSELGTESAVLTKQWIEIKHRVANYTE